MRYQIVEREQIEIEMTPNLVGAQINGMPSISHSTTGVVVFSQEHRVLPRLSEWLSELLRGGVTPVGTIVTYAKNFSYLFDYLLVHSNFKHLKSDEALLDIQEHTLREYFAYLKARGLASTTISNRDATYRAFFDDYLCKARYDGKALREDNPYESGPITGSPKSKLVEMCSLDELHALMTCTRYEREKVVLQFMFDSGVRRSELIKVMKEQIDTALNSERHIFSVDEDTISVPSEYKAVFVAGVKGRKRSIKPRYTLVSVYTLGRVRRYFSTPEYRLASRKLGVKELAFLNSEGRPYTAGAISKLLARVSKRALKKGLIKRAIHPHMLRHGFAGSVLRSPDLGAHSVDKLVLVQNCLGHTFLSTTQVYTRLPYEVYGQIFDKNGETLTRAQLMEVLNFKTKTKRSQKD